MAVNDRSEGTAMSPHASVIGKLGRVAGRARGRRSGVAAACGLAALCWPAAAGAAVIRPAAITRQAASVSVVVSARPAAAGAATGRKAAGRSAAARSAAARPVLNPVPPPTGFQPPSGGDPYAPGYRHDYRHGAEPTVSQARQMRSWAAAHLAIPAVTARPAAGGGLYFHGGTHGIGVTIGHEKTYLVFWGSQWGTSGTNSEGDLTFSGDGSQLAPYAQQLFRGLGTGRETWSGVMTQYCEGVISAAISCPADSLHVAYPRGGALAGVWADAGAAEPASATAHQLAAEAVRAARHFRNLTPGANRDAQYLIISAAGTHPDGFNGKTFCSWHDWNADPILNGGGGAAFAGGPVAFVNLPYLPDAGTACGAGFVNAGSAGQLDGVSIVAGHEYAEAITDQVPLQPSSGGWATSGWSENADLCLWNLGAGDPSQDVTLGAAGTFAMQPTWANDGNGGAGQCEIGHPTVTNTGVFNGGFEASGLHGWNLSGASVPVRSPIARTGEHSAMAGRPGATKGDSVLAQTFTSAGPSLGLWYEVRCPDTTAKAGASVTLTDHTTGKTITLLPRTCRPNTGWKHLAVTVIAGDSYTLKLASHDDGDTADGSYALFDGITNR